MVRVGPKPNETVLLRDRKEQAEAQRKGHVMMGAELRTRDTWSQPEAKRGRKDPSIEPSEGTWLCPHLVFGFLDSRTERG